MPGEGTSLEAPDAAAGDPKSERYEATLFIGPIAATKKTYSPIR
jgi:hypothetical protein